MKHDSTIAFILTNWPNAFPTPQASKDYDSALGDLDARDVFAAVKHYHAADARDFKPSPGWVRKHILGAKPAKDPGEESFEQRAAWDRSETLRIAKAWCGAADDLIRKGKLALAHSAILGACERIAMLRSRDDYWLARRALSALEEAGRPVDEQANAKWLARLRAEPDGDLRMVGAEALFT